MSELDDVFAELQRAFRKLLAHDGGDIPEDVLSGAVEAQRRATLAEARECAALALVLEERGDLSGAFRQRKLAHALLVLAAELESWERHPDATEEEVREFGENFSTLLEDEEIGGGE